MQVLQEVATECEFTPYFWFDLAVNNQHQAPQREFDWWCTTFKQSIARIGRVVLVLAPWSHPVSLTRAWCLYELFSAVDRRVSLDVRLPQAQRTHFLAAVRNKFDAVMEAIVEIDVRNAQAFLESDRANILQAVEASVGCAQLNELIKDRLRQWFRDIGLDTVARAEQHQEDGTLEHAQLLHSLGNLLRRDYGDLARAGRLLDAALEIVYGRLGEQAPPVAQLLYDRALVRYDSGDYQGAMTLLERALELGEQQLGNQEVGNNSDTSTAALRATIINTQATVLRNLGDYDGAVRLHEMALQLRVARLGEQHVEVATILNNMSAALMKRGDWQRAETCMQQALDIRRHLYGDRHPEVAVSYNNLAHVAQEAGDWHKAVELHEEALSIRRETLGDLHPKTAASMNNLGEILVQHGDARGLEYLERALAVREQQLGTHLKTAATWLNVGKAAAAVGNLDRAVTCWQKARDMRAALLGEGHELVQAVDELLVGGGGGGARGAGGAGEEVGGGGRQGPRG